jgi:[ribosomal protein S5]-alanine N-acetyltransferase
MYIELKQAIIREFRPDDVRSIAHNANNREIWMNLRDSFPHPYSESDAQEWLYLVSSITPCTNFALEVEGLAVGGIGLKLQDDIHRRSAELGYWLGKDYWGRGIATEAVRSLTEYSFTHFDLCRIYSLIFSWNPASVKVLEKAGFAYEGRLRKAVQKDGKMTDALLYAIVR